MNRHVCVESQCLSPNSTCLVTSRLNTTLRCVEPRCSKSSTQPKCMGSTRRTCRVVSRRNVTSQVEFGIYRWCRAKSKPSRCASWSARGGSESNRSLSTMSSCTSQPSSPESEFMCSPLVVWVSYRNIVLIVVYQFEHRLQRLWMSIVNREWKQTSAWHSE